MTQSSVPVAVACGAAGAGTGADAVSGASAGTDVAKDGDSCGVTPPGEEPPDVGISGGPLSSKYIALV